MSVCGPDVELVYKDNTKVTDLRVQLENYAIAKFIVGERPLAQEELDRYFSTLDAMGFEEYLKYYADYYDALMSRKEKARGKRSSLPPRNAGTRPHFRRRRACYAKKPPRVIASF